MAHPARLESDRVLGLAALEPALRELAPGAPLLVSTRSSASAWLVAAHVGRALVAEGRRVVAVAPGVESGFRDLAVRCSPAAVASEPVEVVAELDAALAAAGAVAVVVVQPGSAWDRALAEALTTADARARWVLIGPELPPSPAPLPVEDGLDAAAVPVWWSAAARHLAERVPGGLGELEDWLDASQSAAAPRAEVPAEALELGARLLAVGRAWPTAALSALGADGALPVALRHGVVLRRGELLEVAPGWHRRFAPPGGPQGGLRAGPAPRETALALAAALVQVFPADVFAWVRAAELLHAAGVEAEAGLHLVRAARLATSHAVRAEVWARWDALLGEGTAHAGERLVAAELALSLGEADVAVRWAERAAARGAEPVRAAVVLGRAALARGDLVAAEAALARAMAAAPEAARDELQIELGEIRYARGEIEVARTMAAALLERAPGAAVRLAARNLLGKVLLARAEWELADAHFAEDACAAALAGDVQGELRARVNRAIALVSRGSLVEARPILEGVLADAERLGELRAAGFALSNLAVIAIQSHRHAEALGLSERAIAVRRRLGDRLGFARDVTNLVELRLRVGLVDQAEQALRFGRQALGAGAPPSRLSELALAAARIELSRGRTLESERELRAAFATARLSSDGDKVGECHRLAVRLALEDGAVARAEQELLRARELSTEPWGHAEVALLEAAVARAAGRATPALAAAAVEGCRACGDDDLAREAHALAAELALAAADRAGAAHHLRAATALRDDAAMALPPELRPAFLARPALGRLSAIERALAVPDDAEPTSAVPSRPARPSSPTGLVGSHQAIRALRATVARVARTDATVLVHGESGTGKELVAEALHLESGRAAGPLVKVNCSALVESLLLSELFGHEKGAFTGAVARRRGRFERAHGGTLFLDEIGDISPRTQVALLRVLEERSVERVGGSGSVAVDVRIVCATHRDLPELVRRGEFREDLYYRLAGITLHVPPLRDRLSDLGALVGTLCQRIAAERAEAPCRVTPEALELLARHRWPGNVRELENTLRASTLFAEDGRLTPALLEEHVEALRRAAQPRPAPPPPAATAPAPAEPDDVARAAYVHIRSGATSLGDLKRDLERECIARALSETGGNITRAAALLGMKRPRLSQLVKEHALLPAEPEAAS